MLRDLYMIVVKKMSRSCERRGLWSAVMMALIIVLCKRKGKKGQWVYEGVWREGLLDRRSRKGWWKKKVILKIQQGRKEEEKSIMVFDLMVESVFFFHFWSRVLGFSFFFFFLLCLCFFIYVLFFGFLCFLSWFFSLCI